MPPTRPLGPQEARAMSLSIPTHAEWQRFKESFGIPRGAVSGINLGDELERWSKGM